jgi:chromosome segregation ATPase
MLRNVTSFCLLLFALVILSGCAVLEFAKQDVDLPSAEQKLAKLEHAFGQLKAFAYDLQERLANAQAAFEATKSEAAANVVKQTSAALARVQAQLPVVEGALLEARDVVGKLKEGGGTSPLWVVVAMFALRYAPKVLAGVPGLAPFMGPIAAGLSLLEWKLGATRDQKAEENLLESKAKHLDRVDAALSHQVAVTHEALAVLDPKVAAGIKADAAAEQELAGLRDIIRPRVLQIEAVDRAKVA